MRGTLLVALVARATAHFPLVNGASGGDLFSTLATAVQVEDVNRSQATNRVALCNHPYFWFAFDAPEGFDTLMVGGTVPVIARFWDTRVAAAVIGPGLSTDDISSLPAEVQDQIPAGMGAVALPGVPDQSTCHFLEDPLSTGDLTGGVSPYVSSYGGNEAPFAAFADWPESRCFFHEEWGGAEMWVVLDKNVPLSSTGRHYMVFWSPGDQLLGEPTSTAKFGVVFGDVGQSEAFHGSAADAGDCALPAQDFYENACRMEPLESIYPHEAWHAECEPFYGVPVPNLYACSESAAADEHCNTLCHNEGTCLPADEVVCPGECAETCSHAACPGTQGPLGPACPDGCSAGRRRHRKLLFGSFGSNCPPECLGDFHHDHAEEEEMVASADDPTIMCHHDDYDCIYQTPAACADNDAGLNNAAGAWGMTSCAAAASYCTDNAYGSMISPFCPVTCGTC